MKKTFRDFDKAREFVQSLNLKNTDEWREFTKSPKKPYDIPTNPNMIYKRHGWKGLKDWIGTGEGRKMGFKPYEEAKAFVQSLGIGYQKEWKEYCKSGNKPDDIPVAPDITYKDKGWENWGEWLGTGRMKNKEYRSFEEAKKFVMSLNLKNSSDWDEYCKSGNKPDDIPTYPNQVYKDKGWEGYKNWLGTEFLSYKEARKFVHSLKIKGQVEWNKYSRSGRKPDNIPAGPDVAYKGEGWKNWGDFLGTGRVRNLQFKSYKEAKEFAHSLNMKSSTQWKKYSKSGKKPNDIPSAPDLSYKNKGWKNWGDFLGTSGNQYKLTKKQVKNLKTKKVS